jgi:hypothetical protein
MTEDEMPEDTTDSAESSDTDDAGKSDETGKPDKEKRGPSAAKILVGLALEQFDLGLSATDEPYATTIVDNTHIALMLRGGGKSGFKAKLASLYYAVTGNVPGAQALSDAITVLEGMAANAYQQELRLRVGSRCPEVVLIDAGACDDTTGLEHVITIQDGAWKLDATGGITFRRTKLTAPLAMPVRDKSSGGLSLLWRYAVVAEVDRPLVIAWLVSALIQPNTPHPILQLHGEQGTAKSSTTRALVDLIDPSPVPLRKAPRNEDEWVTAAAASWVVGLDNLSNIPEWLSDALCRAATGAGNVKRALYTDGDVAVWSFLRCIIINGIGFGGVRPDLAERLLSAELHTMDPTKRIDEATLAAAWAVDRPVILAGLLDLAAKVHQMIPTITLSPSPRMADFAKVLHAVDIIASTDGLNHYNGAYTRLAMEALLDEPFTAAIMDLKTPYVGKSAKEITDDLKVRLTGDDPKAKWKAPDGWPRSARAASDLLTRAAPAFRRIGWRVSNDDARNKRGVRLWTITPPDDDTPRTDDTQPESRGQSSPPNPPNPPSQVNGHKSGGVGKSANPPGGVDNPPGGEPNPPGGVGENPNPPQKPASTSGSGLGGESGAEIPLLSNNDIVTCECGQELLHHESQRRGNCTACFLKSKTVSK